MPRQRTAITNPAGSSRNPVRNRTVAPSAPGAAGIAGTAAAGTPGHQPVPSPATSPVRDLESTRDRAWGALVGLAAGDAVGTTVEFREPGSFSPVTDMVGGGPFELDPGQWTDDTSMALCLAESLVDRGSHDPVDQLRRYVLWWQRGYLSCTGTCVDIGNTTHEQLSRFRRTGEPEDPCVDEDEAANGSLMRLAPVSIRWFHDADRAVEFAAASSRTTHAATRPVDACRLLAAMTAALIRGEDADAVFDPGFWQHGALHPAVEAIARGNWRTKSPPAIRGTGYCIDALEAALWAVARAGDFRDAILRAANLGDDADTTAAIAGQLAGARFGYRAIPARWRERLAMRRRIESLADGLFAAACAEQAKDASSAGGAMVAAGTGAAESAPYAGVPPCAALRWPFDDMHHAWWLSPGRLLVGEYPGAERQAAAELRLAMLADAGIDTIVDLTDVDEGLEPYGGLWTRLGARRGRDLRRVCHPIRNIGVIDQDGYQAIVRDIEAELEAGRRVYVHCRAGVGRAGTVAGVWLRNRGLSANEAFAALQRAREGTRRAERPSPETGGQASAIRRFVPWRSLVVATEGN